MRRLHITAIALLMLSLGVLADTPAPASAAATSVLRSQADHAAWIAWLDCYPKHCDHRLLAQWQAREPDNAATWMPAVAEAQHANAPAIVDDALKKMAAGSYYADFTYAFARQKALQKLSVVSDSHDPQSLRTAFMEYYTASAMQPISLDGLADACRSSPDTHAARSASCTRIGKLMQASGSLWARSYGDTFIVANAASSGQRASAASDSKIADWQRTQLDRLIPQTDCDSSLLRLWLEAIRKNDTEQDMAVEILKGSGIPLNPPSGWTLPPPQPPPPPWVKPVCSQ